MPTIRTRAAKGSELTQAEADANFKRTVSQKTTAYSCLVSDNRSIIECLHATTPFTITLGDAATMANAETGDYEVTITNIGAAAVTVARAGSDTINGSATSLTLAQYSTVTLQVISAGNGYQTISRVGDVGAITVSGNITVSGTVDGRDIATDGTKLDGIETGATADQTNSQIQAAVKNVSGGIYTGRVNSGGTTVSGDSGFTVSYNSSPAYYEITHNLGSTSYTVLVAKEGATANTYVPFIYQTNSNTFRVKMTNLSGTDVQDEWGFILVPD